MIEYPCPPFESVRYAPIGAASKFLSLLARPFAGFSLTLGRFLYPPFSIDLSLWFPLCTLRWRQTMCITHALPTHSDRVSSGGTRRSLATVCYHAPYLGKGT